ncbi:MAG: methionine synthase [Nocardioides sp.]|nr:methionine synthase [Nocardioides sp.]
MTRASGVGSLPGEDDRAFAEAVRMVLAQLEDLPYLPEVPGRGAIASMTGRSLSVVDGLAADLQPAGWRLTDSSGVDHRRARSLLAQDLDQVEEQGQGLQSAFKVQVAGPWTLAATVEKPRGDKVLSDHGARRELAQALAEGLGSHVADVRRRLPGVTDLVVQVDEPLLGPVVDARVPTASGFGRHRRIDVPEASEHLEWVLAAVRGAGAQPWVHSCGPTPWGLVLGAGATGLSADLDQLDAAGIDTFAEALEGGRTAVLGVVPSMDPATAPTDSRLVERVLRWLDMLGLDVESLGDSLVITPTCGLAGASDAWARRAHEVARAVAGGLT